MAMIDYGAVCFLNGKQIHESELYPDVEFSGMVFSPYKFGCEVSDGEKKVGAFWRCLDEVRYKTNPMFRRKSARYDVSGLEIHIREVCEGVYKLTASKDFKHLTIIYGYGIDPDWEVWNRCKVQYLGASRARMVDHEYGRIRTTAKQRKE